MAKEIEDRRKLRNKLARYYFEPSMVGNKIDWDKVPDTDDFSNIPRNSKGIVQIEVGDFLTIMDDITDYILEREKAKEIGNG